MSRPYQFTPDSTRSPLDPKPSNYLSTQPVSFKTNVNRSKTKRWVEAKSYSYDGDDWGDYDEYDEYGSNTNPHPPVPAPDPRHQGYGEPSRSFTEPQPPPVPRKNSFDAGDDRKQFLPATQQTPALVAGGSLPADITPVTNAAAAAAAAAQAQAPFADRGNETASPITVSPSSSRAPPVAPRPDAPLPPVTATNVPSYSSNQPFPPASMQFDARKFSGASPAAMPAQPHRDITPSAMPTPIQTAMLPATPGTSYTPPGGDDARRPPRKSSLSQGTPSGPTSPVSAGSQRDRASSNASTPRIIRPADIYRRMEEERQKERQSLDSSRPSLDSLGSKASEENTAHRGVKTQTSSDSMDKGGITARSNEAVDVGRPQKQALEPVAERKSEYLPSSFAVAQDSQPSTSQSTVAPNVSQTEAPTKLELPQLQRFSGFGDSFWSSSTTMSPDSTVLTSAQVAEANEEASLAPAPIATAPKEPPSAGAEDGLRSVVDQAFTRKDDYSVPPTPISKQSSVSKSDASVSRSNTDSSLGISPIMSRVPSGATTGVKIRNADGRDTSTPTITEEAAESRPSSRPASGTHQIPRKPSPAHSRNVSTGSAVSVSAGPRPALNPNRGESPARSPHIQANKSAPEPEKVDVLTPSPTQDTFTKDLTSREADYAAAIRLSPERDIQAAVEKEKQAQTSFLEGHRSIQDEESTEPLRAESPTKGRVRDLANKFNTSHSRNSSAHSVSSRVSLKPDDERAPDSPQKPQADAGSELLKKVDEHSPVRPNIPGQWTSYTTTQGSGTPGITPGEMIPDAAKKEGLFPPIPAAAASTSEVDLNPTTPKLPIDARSVASTTDTITSTATSAAHASEPVKALVPDQQEQPIPVGPLSHHALAVDGLRPLAVDRAASSSTSSIAPTPPPKDAWFSEDTSEDEHAPSLPAKDGPIPQLDQSKKDKLEATDAPTGLSRASTDISLGEQESDRLTQEIIQTLSPVKATAEVDPTLTAASQQLRAPSPSSKMNRDSSILPSEYDVYWAGENLSERGQATSGPQSSAVLPPATSSAVPISQSPPPPPPASSAGPGLLNKRFSWEQEAAALAAQTSATDVKTASVEQPAIAIEKAPEPEQKIVDETAGKINRDSASGLHVVNAEYPEAVDLPPRLSRDMAADAHMEEETAPTPPEKQPNDVMDSSAIASHENIAQDQPHGAATQSAHILPFRQIMAIKSAPERITAYNSTREQFANMDTGLRNWLEVVSQTSSTPENAALTSMPTIPPSAVHTGSMRHKHTGSISLFTKHGSSNSQQIPTSQYPQADTTHPSGQGPPSPTQVPQHSATMGAAAGKIKTDQMQAKGKELLHAAGILSGKATIGAKGLFAKSKSRFRSSGSEKAHTPPTSSPDTTPPKQRKSSPFNRSSRPSSISLPKYPEFETSYSRETPSTDISRPISLMVSETWNEDLQPQREPGHLGVLPSPATTTAFQFASPVNTEPHVPIPPQSDTSEQILQSVVRNSSHMTPPRPQSTQESFPLLDKEISIEAIPSSGSSDVSPVLPPKDDVFPPPKLDTIDLNRRASVASPGAIEEHDDVSPISETTDAAPDAHEGMTRFYDNDSSVSDSEGIGEPIIASAIQGKSVQRPEAKVIRPALSRSASRAGAASKTNNAPSNTTVTSVVTTAPVLNVKSEPVLSKAEDPTKTTASVSNVDSNSIKNKTGSEKPLPPNPIASKTSTPEPWTRDADPESAVLPRQTAGTGPPDTTSPVGQRPMSLLSMLSSAVTAEEFEDSNSPANGRKLPSRLGAGTPLSFRSPASRNLSPASSGISPQRNTPSPSALSGRGTPPVTNLASIPSSEQQSRSSAHEDDLDLYADHRGVVKGLNKTLPSLSPLPPTTEEPSEDEPVKRRMSTSSDPRPMSFISLPRDEAGIPQQEHIDRSPTRATAMDLHHPQSPVSNHSVEQSTQVWPPQQTSAQTTYSPLDPTLGRPVQTGQQSVDPRLNSAQVDPRQYPDYSPSQYPSAHGASIVPGQFIQAPLQQPPVPYHSQHPAAFNSQFSRQPTDPRLSTDHRPPMDPRQSIEYRPTGPAVGPPQPSEQKSRIGSFFKSKTGRSASASAATPYGSNLQAGPPGPPHRAMSYQPTMGGVPEIPEDKKSTRRSSLLQSLRPDSPSNHSQQSHESTKAQPTESRLDLRYPSSPVGGIPPPKPVQNIINGSAAASRLHRASTSNVPETGKKKRFSSLGSLFSRSGTTGHAPKLGLLGKGSKTGQRQSEPPQPHRQFSFQQYPQEYYQQQMAPQRPYPTHPMGYPPTQPSMGTSSVEESRSFSPDSYGHPAVDRSAQSPPPGGYYAPDWVQAQNSSGPGIGPKEAEARGLSSVETTRPKASSPTSQKEPKYDTPQIPPAYGNKVGYNPQAGSSSTSGGLLTTPERPQHPRIPSLGGTTHQERPWKLSLPEEEDDKLTPPRNQLLYQQQMMQYQQMQMQMQMQQNPIPFPQEHQSSSYGFREVLPRNPPPTSAPSQLLQQQYGYPGALPNQQPPYGSQPHPGQQPTSPSYQRSISLPVADHNNPTTNPAPPQIVAPPQINTPQSPIDTARSNSSDSQTKPSTISPASNSPSQGLGATTTAGQAPLLSPTGSIETTKQQELSPEGDSRYANHVTDREAAVELPTHHDSDDDEPQMLGVSYPGMEWVPAWEGD